MVQSLLAIAAYVALLGGVIFGVSRFEKRSQKQGVELRVASPPQPTALPQPEAPQEQPDPVVPPVAAPAATMSTKRDSEGTVEPAPSSDAAVASVEPTSTPEPVADPPSETAQTTLDLGEIATTAPVEEPAVVADVPMRPPTDQLALDLTEPVVPGSVVEEPSPIQDTDPTVEDDFVVEDDFIEPRSLVEAFTIAPTIQDPKRPNSDELDNLTQDILAWGTSRALKHVSKLNQCATHRDPIIRGHAARTLGDIAARRPLDRAIESMIPVLGKLTNDSNLQVRQFAVKSLGEIRSPKVLPYLEQALNSPSSGVKKAAQTALDKLKLGYPSQLTTRNGCE